MTHHLTRADNVSLPILNTKGESLGMTIDAYDRARPQTSTERIHAFCLAPFTAVDFGPDGTITVCNHYNHWIARIEEHESFLDVWRGPEFQKLRDDMRNYVLDEDRCRHCARHIRSGMPTQTFATLQFDAYPPTSTQPEFPEYLIFRLSNNCNLACVMCDEYFSSVIREKREELPPIKRYYGDRFFDDIRQILPTARYVEFYGGEPFLVPEHRRVFELIEETGSQCGIYVNTNGTSLNARSKHWLETLNFKVIAVSMDASNAKLHSRTRIGIVHQVLHQNFRWLLELRERKGISLSINVTELRQNWFDLPQMFRFAASVDCGVHINTCVSPPHCSLYTLPTDQLEFVNDYLKRERDRLGSVLDVRGNRESYSLLLQMIDEELSRRGPEDLLPIEISVCRDRYGTKGLLAAPIPGEAPFDTPEAVMEEIDRILAAKLTCEERLLNDMLGDLADLVDQPRWGMVRRRLEELCCDVFVEFFPIDRDARTLEPALSPIQAYDRLNDRYSSSTIDTVAVDSNGRLIRDACCTDSFLGVPLEPLWGRPLVDLDRELRRLHGRTSRAWEVSTPAFSEKLAISSESKRAIASVSILRWNSRRQIEGNIFVATCIHGPVPKSPFLTGLFTHQDENGYDPNANITLAERAFLLMRTISSDQRVLRIEADDKEIVSKLSGEIDEDGLLEESDWIGRRVEELFAHLECNSPPAVHERYWRPYLFDRVARSSTSSVATRLLTLPQFNASGRVSGSVTFALRIANGVGLLRRLKRQEKVSFIDVYTHLVLRQFSGTKARDLEMTPARVLAQRRRVYPDAEIKTIWTDFYGVIVDGPDETWFNTSIRSYLRRPWDELFEAVTGGWGQPTFEIDDSKHFTRQLYRFQIGGEERVVEQLVFARVDSADRIGSSILVVTSSAPPRTELCLQFEERQYLGRLPAEAICSEDQALAALSNNGGEPLVRFRVDPCDTVLSVQSLEKEPRVDFSSAVGSKVMSIHIRLVESFGMNVVTVEERNEAGFKDCVLRFLKDGSEPTLLRVILVPGWGADGSVECVDVFMGFVAQIS